MEIVRAANEQHVGHVQDLFREYWDSFGFTPCFQGFDQELAALPGKYAPSGGALGLALEDGVPAGCVAMRPFDAERCEVKRLYVRPAFRGRGLSHQLMDWVMAQALSVGYREMLGDTMPVMQQALAMYLRMGFEQTGPYSTNPTPGAIFLRYVLKRSSIST